MNELQIVWNNFCLRNGNFFMKTYSIWILFIALLLAGCSKNQRQVNRIDGKWNVVEATIQGQGTLDPDIIYEFEYCRLKKENLCDFSIHNFDTDDVHTGVYTISENGSELTLVISSAFGVETRTFAIDRLGTRRLILTGKSTPNGEFSRLEMRKVN